MANFLTSDNTTSKQGTTPWVDNISQVGGASITLGQKTSANSFPVVIASDQTAIPVTQTPAGFAGTVKDSQVAMSTTAAAIPTTPLASRKTLQIQNNTAGVLYLGGASVTTTTGFQIQAGDSESIDLGSAVIYGVLASGSGNINILEIS